MMRSLNLNELLRIDWYAGNRYQPKRRPRPTEAMPGTQAKIAVLAARYAAGEEMWHEDDAEGNED